MDWLSALSVILLVFSFTNDTSAAGRKKIRIHIPQKVKHIHHHKKVYITKHLAQPTSFVPQYANSDHYASGYLSASPESASVIAPTLALLPLAEGRRSTPGSSPAPNIQPMYRARGHYGPTYSTKHTVHEIKPSSKRVVKVIKISDGKKKRIVKKKKPKRIIVHNATPVHEDKDSNPMSTYHEQFYSDLKSGQNTVKSVKKPKHVEKYVEGDTEHIHTYSEEHIHQVVYDEPPPTHLSLGKPTGTPAAALMPIDMAYHQVGGTPVSPILSPTSILPVQSTSPTHVHPMNAYYGGYSPMGTLGTPPHLEYMHYDPQDVTHDHMYHDHGEIIHQLIPEKKMPSTLPKASYNGQGFKVHSSYSAASSPPSYGGKIPSWVPQDNEKPKETPQTLAAYYENFYAPKKQKKPSEPIQSYKDLYGVNLNKYKYTDEIPANSDVHYEDASVKPYTSKYYNGQNSKKPKGNSNKHSTHAFSGSDTYKKPKNLQSLRQHHYHKAAENKPYSTVPSFSESYTLGHHITINNNYKEPKQPAKSNKHYTNIYSSSKPVDAFPTVSTELKAIQDENETSLLLNWRGGKKNKNKKSISTQNISFGGQEHKMTINHESVETRSDDSSAQPSIVDIAYIPKPIPYVPFKSSPVEIIPDSSSGASEFRIVKASPMMVVAESAPVVVEKEIATTTTTSKPVVIVKESPTTVSSAVKTTKTPKKQKKKASEKKQHQPEQMNTNGRGRYKYGDKLQDRYDYEYDELLFV